MYHSLSWLSISLNGCATISFVHSSVDGHLGCFHLLPIMNSAAINILYKYLFEYLFSVLLDIYLGVEMLGYMVISCLTLRNFPSVLKDDFTECIILAWLWLFLHSEIVLHYVLVSMLWRSWLLSLIISPLKIIFLLWLPLKSLSLV